MDFLLPDRTLNYAGEIRKVGFEIEFGGIDLEEAAGIIKTEFGGEILRKSHFSYHVLNSAYGNFVIESDSHYLSEEKYKKYFEKFFDQIAGKYVPFEIAMPPLKMTHLEPAENLRLRLHEHSATGTRSSIFAAFGAQINIEPPSFKCEVLLSYLRSFFLMYDWLFEEMRVPLARQLSPYIHPFPDNYVQLVLNEYYNPDITELMDDYLSYNPTRNRPLDLLPLFSYLDHDRVFNAPIEKSLVKSRPTFHYRLPNSEIEDQSWTLAKEWNRWMEIENLAANPTRIRQLTNLFQESRVHKKLLSRHEWIQSNV